MSGDQGWPAGNALRRNTEAEMRDGTPLRHRTPEAEQQIADAREEPTIEELQAQAHNPQIEPEAAITLTGPRLAAYLRLESAAKAAQAAQASLASTGQELRDAIGEMCKAVIG